MRFSWRKPEKRAIVSDAVALAILTNGQGSVQGDPGATAALETAVIALRKLLRCGEIIRPEDGKYHTPDVVFDRAKFNQAGREPSLGRNAPWPVLFFAMRLLGRSRSRR